MADVTDANFGTDVIERSKTVPVVIDLWAEWCGPCKTLGPILEKVIGETKGLVELAKVEVEANPKVAQAFQVQSIPAVYAMKDGKVIDSFVGALPEADVVAFVQRVLDASSDAAPVDESSEDAHDGQGDAIEDSPIEPTPMAQTAAPTISEPGADVIPSAPALSLIHI